MESAFQIHTLCETLHPDCVLVVDALAGLEADELCRCVQVSTAGIAPGSGVGNDRDALNDTTLGVPVVAIGVPTVIDASVFSDREELQHFFVTPRFIDSAVRVCGRLIGFAINRALNAGLSVADMESLVL